MFPGWVALLPVLGTALVITAGNQSWINRNIFSNKIAVWFGLISFPLYLWHWPLLSFARVVEGRMPGWSYKIGAVLVSVLLAWLTHRFLERRIRSSEGNKFAVSLIFISALLTSAGAYIYLNKGLDQRAASKGSNLTAKARAQFMGTLWPYTKNDLCLNEYKYKDAERWAWWFCMKSDSRKPTIAILGNSYANQLYPGFLKNQKLRHHTILSIGACGFAVTKEDFNVNPNSPCYGSRPQEQNTLIDNIVLNEPSIKFVIVGGIPTSVPTTEYIEALRQRITHYERKGLRVIIFSPHLNNGDPARYNLHVCFERPLIRSSKDCSFGLDKRSSLDNNFLILTKSLSSSNPSVKFFDQNDIFCSTEGCSFVRNGMPLLRDEHSHLSEYAAVESQKYFQLWAQKNLPEIFDPAYLGR